MLECTCKLEFFIRASYLLVKAIKITHTSMIGTRTHRLAQGLQVIHYSVRYLWAGE